MYKSFNRNLILSNSPADAVFNNNYYDCAIHCEYIIGNEWHLKNIASTVRLLSLSSRKSHIIYFSWQFLVFLSIFPRCPIVPGLPKFWVDLMIPWLGTGSGRRKLAVALNLIVDTRISMTFCKNSLLFCMCFFRIIARRIFNLHSE